MGKYRIKNCQYCKKEHRKKGKYCSQSCANRDRPQYSEKVRENMRKVAIEHNQTPEAIAQQKLLHTGANPEDFAIEIPDIKTLEDYDQFTEGFQKAEKW